MYIYTENSHQLLCLSSRSKEPAKGNSCLRIKIVSSWTNDSSSENGEIYLRKAISKMSSPFSPGE